MANGLRRSTISFGQMRFSALFVQCDWLVVSMHVPEMIGGAEERPRFCSRKWTASMDEPLEATGRVGLWIHLGLLTISETCRQHLPKREGTYKNSHRFAYGDHGGGEVTFLYSEDLCTWLRNTMTTERLSDFAVISVHANAFTIDRSVGCEKFVALHPRRMMASSLSANQV